MSLREKLFGEQGSLRQKLWGGAQVAAGTVARSKTLQAEGLKDMGVKDTVIGEPVSEKEISDKENLSQRYVALQRGYYSDEMGNETYQMPLEQRKELAKSFPGSVNELLVDLPEEERQQYVQKTEPEQNRWEMLKEDFLTLFDDEEDGFLAMQEMIDKYEPKEVKIKVVPALSEVTKEDLVFQEATAGNGLPYLKKDGEEISIGEFYKDMPVPEPEKKIKKLTITDPEEGTYVIDEPEKVKIANTIKAISDAIAPEYTDYLLRLAVKEGGYNEKAFRGVADNPGGGNDRGIFQINDKYFPTVTDEMANDVRFSVLWALSAIESGKQNRWVANPAVLRSKTKIEYEE